MTGFDFASINPEAAESFIDGDPDLQPDMTEPLYDEPSPDIIKQKVRSVRARAYEKKVAHSLNGAFRLSVAHPATVADAAALVMYGPKFAEKWGDLADESAWVARGIDFITEGSDNAMAAALAITVSLGAQTVRNHEPILIPAQRGLRIPGTKRFIRFKIGIKLGRVRNLTNDPNRLVEYVFTNEKIVAALKKNGLTVASQRNTGRDRRE
jgi:hypothetical protein